MFCPKCGTQNTDETKYCRGCGVEVGNVLAIVEGRSGKLPAIAEKHIDVFSSGLRGLMLGVGFLIVSGVSFGISIRLAVLGVFALAFSIIFLSVGVSRLVKASALKRLLEPRSVQPELTTGSTTYIAPTRSIYETDELSAAPGSVTDHTTRHLEMDREKH
jgi:hypothetical protein